MARVNPDILNFIKEHPSSSSGEIHEAVGKGSFATTKRAIAILVKTGQLIAEGQTRATRYILSPANQLFGLIDMLFILRRKLTSVISRKVSISS